MSQINLPMLPHEATKLILNKLPTRRMRDVLEKRFGLKGGRKKTLEAIGNEYKITRERVRQIEADAFKHLQNPATLAEVEPLFKSIESHLKEHGGVMGENHLLGSLVEAHYHPHVNLLLDIGKSFQRLPENEHCRDRWTVNRDEASAAEKIMTSAVQELDKVGHPVSESKLNEIVSKAAQEVMGEVPGDRVLNAYLATSKLIQKNPYGEYGLVSWSTISPRGVRDKAYLVLAKAGNPLHFNEVASAINKVGWSKRKAHPQTVHNELIKDKRFVLVGRGLYALREWGYEPGVVRDVVVSVLKSSPAPLNREDIIKRVLEKRLVKAPTILLNLQNKSLFKRLDDGRYTLA